MGQTIVVIDQRLKNLTVKERKVVTTISQKNPRKTEKKQTCLMTY